MFVITLHIQNIYVVLRNVFTAFVDDNCANVKKEKLYNIEKSLGKEAMGTYLYAREGLSDEVWTLSEIGGREMFRIEKTM